ncbi:hypothetical protein BY996DRAFT_6791446, partial [Phakopsora pachyrhizi]
MTRVFGLAVTLASKVFRLAVAVTLHFSPFSPLCVTCAQIYKCNQVQFSCALLTGLRSPILESLSHCNYKKKKA